MDTSSEIIHGLLPVFLVTELGASVTAIGLLEGLSEATVLVVKLFSGTLSDKLGRRKPLVVFGYAMAAASKPLFALAPTTGFVLAARLADRTGKGIRGAPRDALITDLTAPEIRGRAFGLRQSLDTVGAVLGPALAIALMAWTANDYRRVFWMATVPAVLAVVVLVLGVRDSVPTGGTAAKKIRWHEVSSFPASFWLVVAAGAFFQLARFSEAFLILRAKDLGLPLSMAPLVLIVANLAYALSSYPVGAISDRLGRSVFLVLGLGLLVASDLALATATEIGSAFVGIVLWGLHMGFTQGSLATLVADACPTDRRGTGFGVFSLASAIALLSASVVAGVLWDRFGPKATFMAGGVFAAVSLVALWSVRRQLDSTRGRPVG